MASGVKGIDDVLYVKGRADLAVRVAARAQCDEVLSVGTELVQDWIINRYVNKDARDRVTTNDLMTAGVLEQITAGETEADALYVFDSTLKTGKKEAFRRAFFNVGQMAVFPMFFLSGALYPVAGLPAWLEVLTKINPLTYAVDPMRHLVFSHLDVSETAQQTLNPGVTWWGWQLPPLFEAGMVLLLGLAMLGVATWKFSRTE